MTKQYVTSVRYMNRDITVAVVPLASTDMVGKVPDIEDREGIALQKLHMYNAFETGDQFGARYTSSGQMRYIAMVQGVDYPRGSNALAVAQVLERVSVVGSVDVPEEVLAEEVARYFK